MLPCTCRASDSSQTFNRLLHVGPLCKRQTVFVMEIEAMLLDHMPVPYMPDGHKMGAYLPDSHKVTPCLPDSRKVIPYLGDSYTITPYCLRVTK